MQGFCWYRGEIVKKALLPIATVMWGSTGLRKAGFADFRRQGFGHGGRNDGFARKDMAWLLFIVNLAKMIFLKMLPSVVFVFHC